MFQGGSVSRRIDMCFVPSRLAPDRLDPLYEDAQPLWRRPFTCGGIHLIDPIS